jgi:hypothetical protein
MRRDNEGVSRSIEDASFDRGLLDSREFIHVSLPR